MPEMTAYDHGVPSWVDMGTTDLAASLRFYTELLGWDETEDLGLDAGHYTLARIGGKEVAGLSNAQNPGPPYWATYINVDDVDDIAARVPAAGGTVVAGPMDAMAAGRMVVLTDSTGAVISAWQARDHIGARLVNEPGTFIWSELATSDLAKSQEFYAEVFGWGWSGSAAYAEAQVYGRSVAGVMPRPATLPAEVPDNWLVYFATVDVDEATLRVTDLGGAVMVPPTSLPGTGRFSVVADPQGAVFGLFQGEAQ